MARGRVFCMTSLPRYLATKLATINIAKNNCDDYQAVFAQLKAHYPSIGFQALFDLYCYLSKSPYPNREQQQQLIKEYKQQPKYYPLPSNDTVSHFLQLAQQLALQAFKEDEIPIGAIVVCNNEIIGQGYNQTRQRKDILAHAEIIALQEAQRYLGNYRLHDCVLYVTVEPCLMCSGAIINSRIKQVIFGTSEPKTGAGISQYQVFNNKQVNHHTQLIGPIDNDYYSQLITKFFRYKTM